MPEGELMDWHGLLTLYGFDVERKSDGTLLIERVEHYYDNPSESNYDNPNPCFFKQVLTTLGIPDSFNEGTRIFNPPGESFPEGAFLDAYYQNHHNTSAGLPHDLSVLEPHIARLVRAINDMGIMTTGSCEGHILSRGADKRFFKPGYIACGDSMLITLALLNPRLRINQINEFVMPQGRDATPEEASKAFWGELNETAEIIASNQEKTRELVDTVRKALSLRGEIAGGYGTGGDVEGTWNF
jgi:hypothetical protein